MLAEQNSFFFGDISIDTRRFLQMLAELKSFWGDIAIGIKSVCLDHSFIGGCHLSCVLVDIHDYMRKLLSGGRWYHMCFEDTSTLKKVMKPL